MNWLKHYQLFLFDFDGLLVNTEEIHFQAYKKMCADRGFALEWDFPRYCMKAHYDGALLKESLYKDLPELHEMEPDWSVLYAEKKRAMLQLLNAGAVHLMPGADQLLQALEKKKIPSCVVTNSPQDQIAIIKKYNPVLNSIQHWFTRETYKEPKPNPECYLNAIKKAGEGFTRIIGFEDTPRGMSALLQTPAKPVFVSQIPYPEIPGFLERGAAFFPSLTALDDSLLS